MYININATFTSELIYTYIAKSLGTALQHIPRISPLLIEWLVLYPMFVGELCVSSLPSCLGFLCPYIPNNSQATKVATWWSSPAFWCHFSAGNGKGCEWNTWALKFLRKGRIFPMENWYFIISSHEKCGFYFCFVQKVRWFRATITVGFMVDIEWYWMIWNDIGWYWMIMNDIDISIDTDGWAKTKVARFITWFIIIFRIAIASLHYFYQAISHAVLHTSWELWQPPNKHWSWSFLFPGL